MATSTAPRMITAPVSRVGRSLHPWAWWGWAVGVAVAVSLTTNPLFLLLTGLGVVTVMLNRRSDAPWARAIRAYFILAAAVMVIRLIFHILVGSGRGGTVLLPLPAWHLGEWAQGLTLLGPITAEGLAYTVYDALRLAVMLLCVGAANVLANPRRALRAVPTALYDVAVAVVIALTVAPQLIESALRVRRARRLRGGSTKGLRMIRAIAIPVLEDAIERSLALAAGMEARGYGRTYAAGRENRILTGVLLGLGISGLTFGLYALLALPDALGPAIGCLVVAAALIVGGLAVSGRKLRVTHYRPDPWLLAEWLTVGCGVAAAAIIAVLSSNDAYELIVRPSTSPVMWPQLNVLMLLALVLIAVPAFIAPVPPRSRAAP